ncbi:MAG: hypoxanthine phosphoribosyltransferase [Saprospiraceae bacterium]
MSQVIRLHDKTFSPYLEHIDILAGIEKLAEDINHRYQDTVPLVISVLNGAFRFTADLVTFLEIPIEIAFVQIASYAGTQSTGAVNILRGVDVAITNRDLIILEDIVDSGRTLHHFCKILEKDHPGSIRIYSLLRKPDVVRFPLPETQVAFDIPDRFVVGYGLDYDGLGRDLNDIYQLAD